MIKYCFAYFNKLGNFYGMPFFVDHKEEFPSILKQSLYSARKEQLEELQEEELYFIGSFNNETGEFKYEREFITALAAMASEVLTKKFGVKEHGEA